MDKNSTTQRKFWKIMKAGLLNLMLITFGCSFSIAHDNFGQILDRRVTINVHDVSFEEALKVIENAAEIKFFYSIDQLEVAGKVSIEANDKPLREVLENLFKSSNIGFRVHEADATITLKKNTSSKRNLTIGSEVDKHLVTGQVKESSKQQPLTGVNVLVKGTLNGVSTDADGRFALQAEDDDVLVFSFIGYKTLEERIGARTVVDVVLEEDIAALGEVEVNAGYWKVTDRDKTGSISRITREEIDRQPVSNPIATLQGRIPGLEVTQMTGTPGGNFKVRIRGRNSIENGNDPLYIVDGVPYTSVPLSSTETSGNIYGNSNPIAGQGSSPLNTINPADIESIEVLKDADATAVYGSRGANGVILITTRKGAPGKTKIDMNVYTGAGRISKKLDLLKTQQYLAIRHQGFRNDNVVPTVSNAPDLLVWDTTRYTDWQKMLVGGTSHTTDAQLSISGGEGQTQFSFGGGYHRETVVFPGDNFDERFSARLNISNTSLNKKLRSNLSMTFSHLQADMISSDLGLKAITLAPDAPEVYDSNGQLSWTGWTRFLENPMAFTKRRFKSATGNFIANAGFGYSILPNLEIKSSFGFTQIGNAAVATNPISSQLPAPDHQNSASFSTGNFQSWIIEPQISWRPKIAGNVLDVLVGSSFLSQQYDGLSQTGYGFASEALIENLASAPLKFTGSNTYSQYRYEAFFGRLNYKLKDRYILNLTGRRDGSSRFGPGNQFANFGAVGGAWIFSEALWIKDHFAGLSFGKLRTSYGITGNDQLGDYSYLDSYSSSDGPYQGQIGLKPDRLSNPNFAWESNRKIEAALELGFLNNRLVSTIGLYRNRSSRQLVGFPLPATTGFSTIQGNFPATVQNQGLEFDITSRNVDGKDFSWTTSFNISIPRNKLLRYPNLETSVYATTYVVGQPLAIRRVYKYTGLDPTNGTYTFRDTNTDGTLDYNDATPTKFVGPDFFGGIQNSLRYKSIRLDFLFQFVKQTNLNYLNLNSAAPGELGNQLVSAIRPWSKPGDHDLQRLTAGLYDAEYQRFRQSDQLVSDATFARLKNLSLTWFVPSEWSSRLKLSDCSLFIRGQNLLTITKFKAIDPEVVNGYLAPLKIITIGIHVSF